MSESGRILCISDLHLSAERPDIFKAFSDFLGNTARGASALYILGDFFNLWIGDDDPDPFAAQVKAELASMSASGTEVFLMHGNRDFLIGNGFARDCDLTVIAEPYVLSCFGHRYLLMHGDALCTRDTGYMAFREQVRHPEWQSTFLSQPVAQRLAFARDARAQSKAISSNKADDIMDVTLDEVAKVLTEHGESVLVHGHTHRPAIHDISLNDQAGKRIVLGDWDTRGWYLELDTNGYALKDFTI